MSTELLAVANGKEERNIWMLAAVGRGVLRYGVAALLLFWGALKFTELEAQAIRPLIEHHPLMAWMQTAFGVRGISGFIGVIELISGALICLRHFRPRLSAIGSLIAAGTFCVTLSFLFTTPGALAANSPIGGFLMKDLVLLGASLYTAAEALEAASPRRTARVETGSRRKAASRELHA